MYEKWIMKAMSDRDLSNKGEDRRMWSRKAASFAVQNGLVKLVENIFRTFYDFI